MGYTHVCGFFLVSGDFFFFFPYLPVIYGQIFIVGIRRETRIMKSFLWEIGFLFNLFFFLVRKENIIGTINLFGNVN